MKEKFKIISRLLKANMITDDEAILLLETEKEYIYNYYRTYPWVNPYYPNYYNYGSTVTNGYVSANAANTLNTDNYSNSKLDVSFSSTEEDNMTVSDAVKNFIQELKSN